MVDPQTQAAVKAVSSSYIHSFSRDILPSNTHALLYYNFSNAILNPLPSRPSSLQTHMLTKLLTDANPNGILPRQNRHLRRHGLRPRRRLRPLLGLHVIRHPLPHRHLWYPRYNIPPHPATTENRAQRHGIPLLLLRQEFREGGSRFRWHGMLH